MLGTKKLLDATCAQAKQTTDFAFETQEYNGYSHVKLHGEVIHTGTKNSCLTFLNDFQRALACETRYVEDQNAIQAKELVEKGEKIKNAPVRIAIRTEGIRDTLIVLLNNYSHLTEKYDCYSILEGCHTTANVFYLHKYTKKGRFTKYIKADLKAAGYDNVKVEDMP